MESTEIIFNKKTCNNMEHSATDEMATTSSRRKHVQMKNWEEKRRTLTLDNY